MVGQVEEIGSIDKLPEDVLGRVMSILNTDCENGAVHFMQVCKRWKAVIPPVIVSLTLSRRSRSLLSFVRMKQFCNLRILKVHNCIAADQGWEPLFQAIGQSFPALMAFHLIAVKPELTVSDVSSLFIHCPLLSDLRIVDSLAIKTALPFNGAPRSLLLLAIRGAHSLALPHISSFVNLHSIDLSNSIFEYIPTFTDLPLLENLDLSNCWFCNGGTVHLENLPRLTKLSLQGCERLREILGVASLTQLQTLNIYGCMELNPLPNLMTDFPHLQNLSVAFTSPELPQCLAKLTHLKHLRLCDGLDVAHLGLPTSLEDLSYAIICGIPDTLPSLEGLTALTSLEISAGSPDASFASLGRLPTLRKLRVQDCPGLIRLSYLNNLTNLHELTLSNCPALEQFDFPPTLQKLLVESCGSLESLCHIDGAKSLREMNIQSCRGLRKLPSLTDLVELTVLIVDYCYSLENYPAWGGLPSLRELSVHNRMTLTVLPALPFRSLEFLDLSGINHMHALPDMSGLLSLKRFKLCNCAELNELPVLKLPSLQVLKMIVPKVRSLPPFDGLPALQILCICCCNISTLPPLQCLVSLRELDLWGCKNLEVLPTLQGLTSLLQLSLAECTRLAAVPLEGLSSDLQVKLPVM